MKIHHTHPLNDTGMLMYIHTICRRHIQTLFLLIPSISRQFKINGVFVVHVPYRRAMDRIRPYLRNEYYFSICYRVTADP